MNNSMRNIFIKVKKDERIFHKDLLDASKQERIGAYEGLSKGQVIHILEQFVENKITEENLK